MDGRAWWATVHGVASDFTSLRGCQEAVLPWAGGVGKGVVEYRLVGQFLGTLESEI